MAMRPKVYNYDTSLKWIGAHRGRLSGEDFKDIEICCPPEWGGEPGFWTPENLFVASIEVCIMTTFIDLIERKKVEIVSYRSRARGEARLLRRSFRFATVQVDPVVEINSRTDPEYIKELLIKAKNFCMVSNSLSTEVNFNPIVKVIRDKGTS